MIGKGFHSNLLVETAKILFFISLRSLALFAQDAIIARVITEFQVSLRRDLFSRLLYRDTVFYYNVSCGNLLYSCTSAVERVSKLLYSLLHSFIPSFVQFCGVLVYMFFMSPPLTLSLIGTMPLMLTTYNLLERVLLNSTKRLQETAGALSSLLSDTFRNIRLIQSYGAQKYMLEYKLKNILTQLKSQSYQFEYSKAAIVPIITISYALSVLVLLLMSAYLVGRGSLSSTTLITFVSSIAFLIEPLQVIASNAVELRNGEVAWELIRGFLHARPQVADIGTDEPQNVKGHVEFRNVCFSYSMEKHVSNETDYVLSHIQFNVPAGNSVAIIGHSGSGKTTLLELLSRFYDPLRGSILIDGVDCRNMKLASLRKLIGFVPQDAPLISGTILENIALGEIHIDMNRVYYAAKAANAWDFISELEGGFSYDVGEGGCRLSGGQKQRIAIARAVYTDPRILVFDEATSSLDAESEAAIQSALQVIAKNRTVFIVAHRLSTIQSVDLIVVLEKGRIIEFGTPSELLKKNGKYAEMLKAQFSEASIVEGSFW
ncbi:Lipid A export ATP-binding/permease protein MsbA [Galdieria sulphuraria]|uniref:Probable ATP-dependent transporter ycf16 n=1 Tax=Galdieria sulphuraria TaxID=130081 RepID=M2Y7P7_GALSU|nr:ABC transporter, subfamily B, ATP-binding & transmembrane domain [Galdieria sulphuraria]EME32103.1 ABC transporter, subfamily B, ATP-binding & transmembrane domain [Galdieria sulphuraria]GJD06661.1 Lipid A export ATP-binding/permease protein MsbA [Galdieria sulphuraria]|eukprot:XP_005708623.1 ABC transporter, subfamily B, ATP-binding & transmembrane domain [Galdieria sulphuraria]